MPTPRIAFGEVKPKNLPVELHTAAIPFRNVIANQISDLSDQCEDLAKRVSNLNHLLGYNPDDMTDGEPGLFTTYQALANAEKHLKEAGTYLLNGEDEGPQNAYEEYLEGDRKEVGRAS